MKIRFAHDCPDMFDPAQAVFATNPTAEEVEYDWECTECGERYHVCSFGWDGKFDHGCAVQRRSWRHWRWQRRQARQATRGRA